MVRTLSFVQSFTFQFGGSMFQEAITLADFDNDGLNELCIGNVAGDLAIFKGCERKWSAANLGMITCLGVGDIKNVKKNSLVVITGEGLCHVLDHDHTKTAERPETDRRQTGAKDLKAGEHESPIGNIYTQKFPLNIKQLIISDVSNRGANDLVVILDTVVRVYSWDGGAEDKLKHQDIQIYNFERPVDVITVNTSKEGLQSLFVCVPSEGIKILKAKRSDANNFLKWELVTQQVKFTSPVTDAIGDIRKSGGGDNMVSFSTLDGLLKMYQGDEELWSLALDNPIFALVKTDIDKDDTDEVVACSWDGFTFFVDHHKNCVKYKFEESVTKKIRAFSAGQYAIGGSTNKPALVYVTFSGDVVIKYDVELTSLGIQTLEEYSIDLSPLCTVPSEHMTSQHRANIIRDLLSFKM